MAFAPKHLFVAVDADVTADPAIARLLVEAATELARTFGARVTLCHVALPVVTSPVPPVDSFGEAYRAMSDVLEARNAAASRTLDELTEHMRAQGVTADAVLVTRSGNIPELIGEAAVASGADLMMLATHARRGIQRLLLGSVAERTVHLAPLPLLLLPPSRAR